MSCPSHPHWLDHSNYIWRRVQVIKLLIMQNSPFHYKFKHQIQLGIPHLLFFWGCEEKTTVFCSLVRWSVN
jgi:hypothetical protein